VELTIRSNFLLFQMFSFLLAIEFLGYDSEILTLFCIFDIVFCWLSLSTESSWNSSGLVGSAADYYYSTLHKRGNDSNFENSVKFPISGFNRELSVMRFSFILFCGDFSESPKKMLKWKMKQWMRWLPLHRRHLFVMQCN
jgi:hypothetical protein